MAAELLTRDNFRERVFQRDDGRCVICRAPAVDAHHIIERRLWPDGGYYVDNGASLCAEDHIRAEQTVLSCEEIREAAGITAVVLPPDFERREAYTKWGDIVLPDGRRSPGPLFDDGSVQKVLREGKVLDLYTRYVKHPRIRHLPWSGCVQPDDVSLDEVRHFEAREIVATEKLDGEQTTIYFDGHSHARSLDSGYHPSRTRIRALAASIGPELPHGWRVCGENMVARHEIAYRDISPFLVHSIWNEHNVCLSWAETREWAELLGLPLAPVLYEGPWDEDVVRCLWLPDGGSYAAESEGYVIRIADAFSYREFAECVAKYVRPGHITSARHHWFSKQVVENEILELT